MKEIFKDLFFKFILPILASMVFGLDSAALTGWVMVQQLNNRVTELEVKVQEQAALSGKVNKLETTIERHEKELDRDFFRHEQTVASIMSKTEDQEKRLTRLETLVNETQRLLEEIRSDVKIILRGGQQ